MNQLQREHLIMLQEMKRQEIELDQALQLIRDLQKTGKTNVLQFSMINHNLQLRKKENRNENYNERY